MNRLLILFNKVFLLDHFCVFRRSLDNFYVGKVTQKCYQFSISFKKTLTGD